MEFHADISKCQVAFRFTLYAAICRKFCIEIISNQKREKPLRYPTSK